MPPCSRGLDAHAVHAGIVADDLVDRVIPGDAHLAGLLEREQAILQDLLRAELVAPVHDGDVAREVREVERLFDGGIAAADDHDACGPCRKSRRRSRRPRRRLPRNFSSDGMPRYLADAPVAMISASQVYLP